MPRVARKDLPPLGRLLAEDDGSRVQCHVCGRWWALLGMHVSRGHGMTPDAYREQFGLNRTTGLVAPALARRLAEVHGARLARRGRAGFDALTPSSSTAAGAPGAPGSPGRSRSRMRRYGGLPWRRSPSCVGTPHGSQPGARKSVRSGAR